MSFYKTTKLVVRSPFRIAKRTYLQWRVNQLRKINEQSSSRIVQPGGPVVSLTTYGPRIETAYVAIESIARGRLLPSELILWLDEEECYKSLPITLERLKKRGLTVTSCKNYGPHKKYFPYVHSREEFVVPLVTADDDILYPRDWLESLTSAWKHDSTVVNCYRARIISVQGNDLAPYRQWPLCRSTRPSWRHLANGVSGVIYPPRLLAALRSAGSEFEHCCPKADDIWLHANALRAGFMVKQIRREAIHFPMIPGSQESALYFDNAAIGNDIQIAKTYSQSDVQRIAKG